MSNKPSKLGSVFIKCTCAIVKYLPYQDTTRGGVRKVRKPQNRTKNNKKPQYRIEIYRNTETAGCLRQDLQSFYTLKIRSAVYADINSNVKLLNYEIISIIDLIAQSPSILNYAVMHFNMTCSGLINPITWFTFHNIEGVSNR